MTLYDDLARQGWSEQAGFLSLALGQDLLHDLSVQQESGALTPAGIGRGSEFQIRNDIRRDVTMWLDGSTNAQKAYLAQMEELQMLLNRTLFLGLDDFEAHYALYPPGGFYKTHLDALKGERNRIVSTVTYLTPDWQEEDGGHLVLYDENHRECTRILPRAGTLAIFMSEDIPHEVLPPRRARCSIAGWFRCRGGIL